MAKRMGKAVKAARSRKADTAPAAAEPTGKAVEQSPSKPAWWDAAEQRMGRRTFPVVYLLRVMQKVEDAPEVATLTPETLAAALDEGVAAGRLHRAGEGMYSFVASTAAAAA